MRRKNNWIPFFICYLAYVSIYIARTNLSMAAPELKSLGVLTTEQIGLLGSAFSVVYACGRLLSGYIADRVKPSILVCIGLCLCSLGNLLCGTLPGFAAFLGLWSINALSQSMLWGPILRILSAIYPPETAQRRASYMGSAVAAGNIAGILLTSSIIQYFGVRWAFLLPGLISLTLAGFVVFFTGSIRPAVPASERAPSARRNRDLLIMLIPAFIHGVMKDNISLWMTAYAVDRFGMNLESSTCYVLLIPILGFLGRILAPTFLRFAGGRENILIVWSLCLSCLGTGMLSFVCLPGWAAIVMLSIVYMAVSVINACLLSFFPIRFTSSNRVASVSGIMDFATYLGTGVSAAIYGSLIVSHGYESMFFTWCVLSALGSFAVFHYYIKSRRNFQ